MAYDHAINQQHLDYWRDRKANAVDDDERRLCDDYMYFYEKDEAFLIILDKQREEYQAQLAARVRAIRPGKPPLTLFEWFCSPLYFFQCLFEVLLIWLMWLAIGAGVIVLTLWLFGINL